MDVNFNNVEQLSTEELLSILVSSDSSPKERVRARITILQKLILDIDNIIEELKQDSVDPAIIERQEVRKLQFQSMLKLANDSGLV